MHYQHILFATDFSSHSEHVAKKAYDLAKQHQATLSIIHIVDYLPITENTYGPIIPFDQDIIDSTINHAKQQLKTIANQLSIPENKQFLDFGNTALNIIEIANQQNIDLIVLGSHGRHGLALLLGSTANNVLHHANCDVLAVRLKDN